MSSHPLPAEADLVVVAVVGEEVEVNIISPLRQQRLQILKQAIGEVWSSLVCLKGTKY